MLKRDLWVDFNDADAKDRLSTVLEYATPGARIDVGTTIVVGDDEGNRCSAYVLSVDEDGVVELALDGDSFQNGAQEDDRALAVL